MLKIHLIGLQVMIASALLAPALLFAQATEAQTFEEAKAAYERGDYAVAFDSFRVLAEQGHARARAKLGVMYAEGRGVPKDDVEAVRWYRRAAEQGDTYAQVNLGLRYARGKGVPQDDAEAVRWYRRAAEQGDAYAQVMLGSMYDEEENLTQDDAAKAQTFDEASAAYERGDYAVAFKSLRTLAEQGDAEAQTRLGAMYALGRGAPQDDVEAVRWLRQAVEQGHVDAPVALRLMAEQGSAWAQFNLGFMYAEGHGVSQDNAQAVHWYLRAAEQGEVGAQFNLGVKYVKGEGVPQDYVQAHKWLNLAASRFSSAARKWRDKAVKARDGVALIMTPAQIAEAQRLARGWTPKQFVPRPSDVTHKRKPSSRYPVKRVSNGSGFFVSNNGHILTNAHVVSECAEVRIPPAVSVRVAARDDSSDLALLRGETDPGRAFATFRQGRGIRPGADVVVIGYPLQGVVASEANVTRGNVSALAGPGDDRRLFQMTAPVQPGNSGGPVLDRSGHVVGVTVAKLNAIKTARATGDIPQNVNFAVSAGTARSFLDAEGVPYQTTRSSDALAPAAVAVMAKEFTVIVECWK